MNKEKILAGLDAGHIHTKVVLMRGDKILGRAAVPTGFDAVAAAQTVLDRTLETVGVSVAELAGMAATGIFRDRIKAPPLNAARTIPEDEADAKGALFLNRNSRTVIDIGGNIHKAIRYDENGKVLNVIQNDKCADGLGIFYTSMARALGVNEHELSELALKSTKQVSVSIHCAVSAESEAIGLMCEGVDIADVADAITRFMVERVAAMSTFMSLSREIVVAGGLAKSKALIKHLSGMLRQDVHAVDLPEYVGAIGAALSC